MLSGVWYSDAIEIVHIVLGPVTAISYDDFNEDVNKFVYESGKKVPVPTYKNIF